MGIIRKYLVAILSGVLLLMTNCNKEQLTKATQTGANTFSCLVDGKVFKPCKSNSLFVPAEPLSGGVTYRSGINSIPDAGVFAECLGQEPRRRVSVSIEKFQGTGEYSATDHPNVRLWYEEDDTYYQSDLTGNGKLIITKDDRTNRILSGTFEFTAANSTNPSAVVKVTSGRFDISY